MRTNRRGNTCSKNRRCTRTSTSTEETVAFLSLIAPSNILTRRNTLMTYRSPAARRPVEVAVSILTYSRDCNSSYLIGSYLTTWQIPPKWSLHPGFEPGMSPAPEAGGLSRFPSARKCLINEHGGRPAGVRIRMASEQSSYERSDTTKEALEVWCRGETTATSRRPDVSNELNLLPHQWRI